MKRSLFLALSFGAFVLTGKLLTTGVGGQRGGYTSDAVFLHDLSSDDGGLRTLDNGDSPDSILTDTVPPPEEREGDFVTGQTGNPFDLKDPPAITQTVEYDPETGYYLVTEKIGGQFYRPPTYMTFDEYQAFMAAKEQKEYFEELGQNPAAKLGEDPIKPYVDDVKADLAERLFGKGGINIRPQGNIDLTFGGDYQRIDNPILTQQQQRNGGFDFDMNIQMNVVGTIGERLKLSTSYNTQATFDVDNQIKLEFLSEGLLTEDAIIKKIEAGNVSLPLRSSLIQGSQALFGFKTQLQFARLTTTLLVSQQQSRRKEITLQNGTQTQNFNVSCDQYDENRHFYLTHYNRASFEPALKNIPQINTLFHITKLEVWVTNDRNVTDEVRDIVALTDLGETEADKLANPGRVNLTPSAPRDLRGLTLPDNEANDLYERLQANPRARQLDNTVATLEAVLSGCAPPATSPKCAPASCSPRNIPSIRTSALSR
jgi:cell surface protein SprA